MIISVHIPKTAGVSFHTALSQALGTRLLLDYGDRPLSDGVGDRGRRLRARLALRTNGQSLARDYDAIHGHFIADKYANSPFETKFCAFFREPVARVVSNYRHWLAHPNSQNRMNRALHERRLTPAQFAAMPRQARIYDLFIGRVPLDRFAFIGITEDYATSLCLFETIFGIPLPELRENIGDSQAPPDTAMLDELSAIQSRNRRLYDEARRRFEILCGRYLR